MLKQAGNQCRLAGNVTIDSVPGLLDQIRPMIQSGVDTLDCSGVLDVDSSALGFLLACKREARQHKRNLTITNLPASLLSLASLYGIVESLAA